ncbi:MAG: metallophosphoesterase [Nocardioidaceae bacterium]
MDLRRYFPIGAGMAALLVLLGGAVLHGARASSPPDGSGAQVVKPPLVVAVGDIACPPGVSASRSRHTCQQAATAKLAASYGPDGVLVLGDNQYTTGALRAYRASYGESWGRLRSITHPVPGNHEYRTARAHGYYRYFAGRQPGRPGYYAFNIGTWRLYALNDECTEVDCVKERQWMRADLAAHRRGCSLMYMHEPRFSSGGGHGNNARAKEFWLAAYASHVDVALGGHDHDYERFARLDHNGNRTSTGIQSFVVGTGGKSLSPFGAVQAGSAARYNSQHGVLALTLRDGSYSWEFRTMTGVTVDSGSRSCR